MTTTWTKEQEELINDAKAKGFVMSHELEEKIYQELEEVEVPEGHHSYGRRFRNWLRNSNADGLPGENRTVHVSADAVNVLFERATHEPAIESILQTVVDNATPVLRAAKKDAEQQTDLEQWLQKEQLREIDQSEHAAQHAQPKKDESSDEQKVLDQLKSDEIRNAQEREVKKDATTLNAHAKKHGITLTASEVAKVFDVLSPLESVRFQQHLAALEVGGAITGRHGNRTALPEGGIQLTPHQYDALLTACPSQMEKAGKAIAAMHADKQQSGPKTGLQHLQSSQASGSYRSA